MPGPRLSLDAASFPRELLLNLTLRELRSKFKRSVLGWTWSIINPVTTIIVYSIVFSRLLSVPPTVGDPSGLDNYALFLMCALIPWIFNSNCLSGTTTSLVANEGLIKKVWFPRWVLPASSVLAWLASFLIELGVMSLVLIVFGGNMVLPWLPIVLVVVVLQSLFVLGVGMALAPLNAYFRDVEHFVGIIINLWFWATPIIYPISQLYDEGRPREVAGFSLPSLMNLNPMYHFTHAYRDLLYHLRAPSGSSWAYMLAFTVGSLVIGRLVFRRLETRLAEEL